MSQGKVQQNERIEGVLFSKDSDKKRQKSTEKKKKGKPFVKTKTSYKTLHNASNQCWYHTCIKAFCMVLKYNGNTHLEPLRILLRTNQQYDIYIGRSCKLLKNMKKFQVLVQM